VFLSQCYLQLDWLCLMLSNNVRMLIAIVLAMNWNDQDFNLSMYCQFCVGILFRLTRQ